MVYCAVAPVFKPGTNEIIGATGIDFSLDKVYKMIEEYKLGETGYYILVSGEGQIIYHPDTEYKNINIADADMSDNIKNAMLDDTVGSIAFTNKGENSQGYVSAVGETGWVVATGIPDKEFKGTFQSVKATILIIFALALLIICGFIIIISKKIVSPLKKLTIAADKLAIGDVEVNISEVMNSNDEVGELAWAFGKMIDNIKEQAGSAERMAQGDLSIEILPRSDKDVLAVSMGAMVNNLNSLVSEMTVLTSAAVSGELKIRGSAEAFEGCFKEINEGVNNTLDAIVNPLNIAQTYIQKIADGEELEDLNNDYKGDYGVLIQNLISVKKSIYSLIEESNKLTEAAANGELSYRADLSGINMEKDLPLLQKK